MLIQRLLGLCLLTIGAGAVIFGIPVQENLTASETDHIVGGEWGPCDTIVDCTKCAPATACSPTAGGGCDGNQQDGCEFQYKYSCTETDYSSCSESGSGGCGDSQVAPPCPDPDENGECNLPANNNCTAGGTSNCDGCL